MVMVCSSEVATQLPGRDRSASRGKPVTPIRSARRDRRLSPEVLKSIRRKFGVTHRMLDVLVPEVGLQRAGIDAVVCELEAAGMSQHVRVQLKFEAGGDTRAGN